MSEQPAVVPERAEALKNLTQLTPQDEEGMKAYPTIFDLLMPRFKDGRLTRASGSIGIGVTGSLFRVTLRCPTEGLETVWVTDCLKDLFKRLEAYLVSSKAAWTPTYENQKRARQALDRHL